MDMAFMADKGGVGKSTLAFHVATRLRQLGLDVGLVDLDRKSTSSGWHGECEPYFPSYTIDDLGDEPPPHDCRVWDTPAHPSHELRSQLLALVDVAVVVAQTDKPSQLAAAKLYAELSELGGGAVRLMFNAVQPNSSEGQASIDAALADGVECLKTFVRRYRCFEAAGWDDRAVVDGPYANADKAWDDVSRLTDELLALGR